MQQQGYLPEDVPSPGALVSLGFQQVLTMFPATVLVAILTKFNVSVVLTITGVATILALFVTGRRIPLYYGSSFSYIAVVIAAMKLYDPGCFNNPATVFCPDGVRVIQVGIIATGVLEILIGFLVMRAGKQVLDKILPPVVTGPVAIVIGLALAGAALDMAGAGWGLAWVTLLTTVIYSVALRGQGLAGLLPILLGAVTGYLVAFVTGAVSLSGVASAAWLAFPPITLPAFNDPRAWGAAFGIALIAIATIPEGIAHLYQMSLYVDELAEEEGEPPREIKNLVGLNQVADGVADLVCGCFGGTAGTSYGENNSLMAITRVYSVPVILAAGVIAILLGFVGKLAAVVQSVPTAVIGGLMIYLFGVIAVQGIALMQSEGVDFFNPRQIAVVAIILITGIGGAIKLPNGYFPFNIPILFPDGVPAIVFAAIVGIALNLVLAAFEGKSEAEPETEPASLGQ